MVRRHGIELKRVASTLGGEYQGPCPGCGGDDRFHVWPEENSGEGSYWCRQCGKGGDAIQFLRDFEGLSFREACERLGRSVPDSKDLARPRPPKKAAWEAKAYESPEALWREKAGKFCGWCYDRLFEHPEALEYLASRGIRTETAGRYGLGWNPGDGKGKDLYRDRESWGLSLLIDEKRRRRPLWLPVGMVIPCFDQESGEIQRLRIRRPGEPAFGPRYYVVPGSSMATMVLGTDRKVFVVVEAELDGILVFQEAGDFVGVIALGSTGYPDKNAMDILGGAVFIMVSLDFDGPGAKKWPWWKKHFPDCVRWPVPEGKDPGEAFQAGVEIGPWIKAGLPPALQ